MKKVKTDIRQKLIEAALALASKQDWSQLSLEQIAKAAKVLAHDAQKTFANLNDILPAIVEKIDGDVAKAVGRPLSSGTPHDRLFEVMMARFDILQKHRKAILGIIASVKRDPSLARNLMPAQAKALQKMLAIAGLQQDGVKQVLATVGLLAVYVASLRSWERDQTRDMTPTMAVLDRYLRRAGKLAEIVFSTI